MNAEMSAASRLLVPVSIRRALLRGRWHWRVGALILLEAALIAGEVLILSSAGTADTASAAVRLIAVFVAVTLARIVVSATISAAQSVWHVRFVRNLLSASARGACNRPDIYPDRELASRNNAAALSSGQIITANIMQFGCEGVRCALQYAVIAVVFCWVFGWTLLVPIAVGLGLNLFIALALHRRIAGIAEATEESRVRMGAKYGSLWDRIVLGNADWASRWFSEFEQVFSEYERKNRRQSLLDLGLQIAQTSLTYVAFALAVAYLFGRGQLSGVLLIGLLAALPKFIQLLSLQSQLSQLLVAAGFLRGQVGVMRDSLSVPGPLSLSARIDAEAIRVVSRVRGEIGAAAFLDRLSELVSAADRIVLRGRNGAGKSSLLLEIKRRLDTGAVIVPARVESEGDDGGQSTGERHVQIVHGIIAGAEGRVILLDEWDANMDDAHIAQVERLIDLAVGDGKVVIECRHRAVVGC